MHETILHPHNFGVETSHPPLTKEQIENYAFLIHEAGLAEAFPHQSGFFVKTAGMTFDGTVWRGGNKEFKRVRKSGAWVHGETAVASALSDSTDSPIEAIAWYKKGEIGSEDFGRPCGACRDALLDYCSPETVLLQGNEKAFVYTRLRDFLFDKFKPVNVNSLHGFEVNAAILAAREATDVYLPDDLKGTVYGSVLVSNDGTIWKGSLYTNVGYDDVPPVLSSELIWKHSYPTGTISEKHLRLSRLVIACESEIPNVSYRDRQALLEHDEIRRRYTKEGPLRVELVHATRDKYGNMYIHEAKTTNSEEWLPGPFSPGAFRMDDVMDAQLQKLIGRK